MTQRGHIERCDTLLSSGQSRPTVPRCTKPYPCIPHSESPTVPVVLPPALAPRSESPTLPVVITPALAQNIGRTQAQIDREESGARSSGRLRSGDSRRPEWCVDLGYRLKPMTTFELWIAAGNGAVGPDTRVWRDGMECWRKVRNIPELLHALPEPLKPAMAAGEPTGTPPPTVRERSPSEITPLGGAEIELSGPPLTGTGSRAHPAHREAPAEQREASGWRGAYSRILPSRSTVLSVSIGAAVGMGALLFALASTRRMEPRAEVRPSSAAVAPAVRSFAPYVRGLAARAEAGATGAADADLELADEELVFTQEASLPRRSAISPRYRDPGQRRARHGSRP